MISPTIDEVLPLVTRPIRYTGGEYNALLRDPDPARVSWVLSMPEVYELGMSNYGLRILYSIVNRLPNAFAERCYVPWTDFGALLKQHSLPLYALESKRPVRDFDILGVSLQSELSCTNLLWLLDLAQIPLHRAERSEKHPLIVAGGPCTVNPLPLQSFVDAFVVGDGEGAVRDITELVGNWDRRHRDDVLAQLARLHGLFVPGFTNLAADIVQRRFVSELREDEFPFPPLVPICEITHDRLTVEIARGCTRGCRFCQAGMLNRPVRLRPPDEIVRIAERGIRATGWEEVSLLSLSALDYPNLLDLVQRLNSRLRDRRVSISLPSTRGEDFSAELAFNLQEVKKTGLTFAPETASPRLRAALNKNIPEARTLESVRNALDAGWNGVKLYFMIGLPGETDDDVAEIGRFVTEVAKICRGRMVRFNLSPFVPKPHTPLQWAGFGGVSETMEKIDRFKAGITRRNVRAKWENPECSMVQALLARGDDRLGPVIEDVYRQGGVFQEWTEHFRLEYWTKACSEAGVDPQGYLRPRSPEQRMPWDFIDVGVSREFLKSEYEKSRQGTETPDCELAGCTNCGACPVGRPPGRHTDSAAAESPVDPAAAYGRRPRPVRDYEELKTRFRIKYAVEEPYRFAAHLDRVRAFYRSLRRSELPIAYTKGYAPKPMLSFGPPLPVGVVSAGEYLDLFTAHHYTGNIVRDLGPFLPRGLRLVAARAVPRDSDTLGRIVNLGRYDVGLPPGQNGSAAELDRRGKSVNGVRSVIPTEERSVRIDLSIEPGIKLFDALAQLLQISETDARCLAVQRRDCLAVREGRERSPLED